MYGMELHFLPSWQMWFTAALIVCGTLALLYTTRKYFLFGFSASLIVLPLLPALYAMRFSPTIEMVQDRYLYLPSVGFCLVLGWIAKNTLQTWRTRSIVGLTAVTTVFALLCYAQEGFYANQVAMYARAAEYAPRDQYVSLQLANSYAQEGRYEEALVQYKRACPIEADLDCVAGLAEGQYFTHRYAEALPRLQTITRVLDHTDSGHNPTTLIQHEQFLLWLADTQRHLGNSVAAEETDKRSQATAANISAQPEANALARAFKIPTLPMQVSR
jgi:tetratricopeptide (TPR) repeat protein